MMLQILTTPTFVRNVKKLHAKDKTIVDKAVRDIASAPNVGQEKKGDLSGIFVHKFKLNKQELLLSYQLRPDKICPETVVLLSLGTHENIDAGLKRRK